MQYHKVIGIDLGTTYSAVAVWDYDRSCVVAIPSAIGEATLPSVVGIDDEHKVIVGRPANQRRIYDPLNTIIEIKREMGTYIEPPDPSRDFPGAPKRVRFRDRDYLPQEIAAFILAELKRQAERFIGEEIHDAVITVPAYFKEPQRGATEDAAAIARLNVRQLLNEPTAAAVSFGADLIDDGRQHIYAVYDLGGGTFDVSIIEVVGGNVSIIGTGGNPRLGGGDFDDRITAWVLEEIRTRHGVDLRRDEAARARIKQEAELRKRELAAATSTMIGLPFLTSQLSVNLTLTRAVFEQLIADLLQDSLTCLDEAIASAEKTRGIRKSEIEQVLLVGGSTRIRKVRSMLTEYMDHLEENDIRVDINPDEAVARGAALVARRHNPSDGYQGEEIDLVAAGLIPVETREEATRLVLQDVTSHTLGILANVHDFIPIIPKEHSIPAREEKDNFVNAGPSRSVDVLIYQGEDPVAFNNTLIGKLAIPVPEPKEQGYWQFKVMFELDLDGLLSVQVTRLPKMAPDGVTVLHPGEPVEANIHCNVRSSRERLDEGADHLQSVMAAEDSGSAGGGIPAPPAPPMPPPAQPRAEAAGASAPDAQAAPPPSEPSPMEDPPAETPAEFRSIARRSWKLLSQPMDADRRTLLAKAYTDFVEAVKSESPRVEVLGDELGDAYDACKLG